MTWSIHDPIVKEQVESPQIDQLFHDFIERYRGREASALRESKHTWLDYVANVRDPPITLYLARLALSLNRAGWQRSDPILVEEGQKAYTKALGELRKALNDDLILQDDDTLVAGMVLNLYEVCKKPKSAASWC